LFILLLYKNTGDKQHYNILRTSSLKRQKNPSLKQPTVPTNWRGVPGCLWRAERGVAPPRSGVRGQQLPLVSGVTGRVEGGQTAGAATSPRQDKRQIEGLTPRPGHVGWKIVIYLELVWPLTYLQIGRRRGGGGGDLYNIYTQGGLHIYTPIGTLQITDLFLRIQI
jgi:hypothetical protein